MLRFYAKSIGQPSRTGIEIRNGIPYYRGIEVDKRFTIGITFDNLIESTSAIDFAVSIEDNGYRCIVSDSRSGRVIWAKKEV